MLIVLKEQLGTWRLDSSSSCIKYWKIQPTYSRFDSDDADSYSISWWKLEKTGRTPVIRSITVTSSEALRRICAKKRGGWVLKEPTPYYVNKTGDYSMDYLKSPPRRKAKKGELTDLEELCLFLEEGLK